MIHVLKIIRMCPEKTFYNHEKSVFFLPLYETLSSALNKSNEHTWSLRPLSKEVEFLNDSFRLVNIKSVHELPPLKQVLFYIKLIKSCSFKKAIKSGSVGLKLKSPSITLLS